MNLTSRLGASAFAIALFLATSICAQESHIPGKSDPLAGEAARRGMNQFQQACAMCHGAAAHGGSGPGLIDSSFVRHDTGGDHITELIRKGRPDKGMPAFGFLAENQVADIVVFLHAAVASADNRSSGGPAGGYSLKPLLSGDSAAGKLFFQQHCSSCHSVTGDLAGVARKYQPLELEKQILYPAPTRQTGSVLLPSGENISGTIIHYDAFFVAIIDGEQRYHSWPLASGVKVALDDPIRGHRELLDRFEDKDLHDVFAYLESLR